MRWIAALILALLALTSCTSADENRGAQQEVDVGYDSADEAAAEAEDSAQAQAEGPESDLAGDSGDSVERQVITTAYAAIEVGETSEAVADLLGRTTGFGGYVEDRSERTDTDGNPTRASLTLRLPAENLPEMLESLEDLGDVSELSESAQDVTGAVRDLDARIDALETSVDRLIEIMAEAETAEELLQVETTLSQRQADLESLQAERNALGDQVAMSTLQVELSTEPITEVETGGFLGGLQSGWNALVSVTNALLVGFGALVPWLPVIAVPVLVIWLLVRWGRRRTQRRGQKAADQQEPSQAERNDAAPADSGPSVEAAVGPDTDQGPGQRPD